jgi:phosphonate transport system substrate-binding protein
LVCAPKLPSAAAAEVGRALKELTGAPDGPWLLEQLFQMDAFEDAPKMGYQALYRLAVASL